MAFCWAEEPEASIWPFSQEMPEALVSVLPVLDWALLPLALGVALLSLLSSEPQAVRTSAPVIATAPTVRARSPLLR